VNLSAKDDLMKQENESASIPPGKTPDSDTAGKHREVIPAPRAKSEEVLIDFHSGEFNRIDDLNDCAGNYRSFQTLDGVLTAHERHQIELRRKTEALNPSRDAPACPKIIEMKTDDREALEAAAPLTVISEGRTLIIDTDAERAMACAKTLLDHRLSCTLIITGSTSAATSASRSGRIRLLHVDSVSVSGAFAGFSAKVTVEGSEKPLAEWFDGASMFDLVLDLQPVPSFAGGPLPIGYYAPGPSPAALDEAMAELPEMRGQFKKPQFVEFYESHCFHGRSRAHDCHRCLQICPVGAIRSADRRITVNHRLCQGCGGCSLVCPAEAFRMVQPSQKDLLDSLQDALKSRSADGGSEMTLVLSDSALPSGNALPGNDNRDRQICFRVAQVAYLRLEILLSALAYGPREVLVGCDSQNPLPIREAVEQQVQMARAVLRGLGLGEERIRFLVMSPENIDLTKAAQQPACFGEQTSDAPRTPIIFPAVCDGRALVHRAAQYLHGRSGVQPPWLPLPKGSPFGNVAVNLDACTLCMACAGACPSGALSSGGNVPRLVFQEFLCHQCGLCRETCPEDAIELMPRLRLDDDSTGGRTVLREAEPFRCIECGAPFASPRMIDRMKEKLASHWMYASEKQLRRLQMCRTCRTRNALASGETGS
jgi:ferredoxin